MLNNNFNLSFSYNNYKVLTNNQSSNNKYVSITQLKTLTKKLTNQSVNFVSNKNNKRIYKKTLQQFISVLGLQQQQPISFNLGFGVIKYNQYNYKGVNIGVISSSFTGYHVIVVNNLVGLQ